MTDALSSHAADPINRAIILEDVSTLEELGSSLDEVFETADTAAELNRHNLRRVSRNYALHESPNLTLRREGRSAISRRATPILCSYLSLPES